MNYELGNSFLLDNESFEDLAEINHEIIATISEKYRITPHLRLAEMFLK